jgi:Reverse transcriptase (RNA-dependent DNA polymerase)
MKDVSHNPHTGTRSGRGFHVNAIDVREAIGNTHKAHALGDEGARQHFEEQQKRVEPQTAQARAIPKAMEAAEKEMGNIHRMKTFHLIPRSEVPKGALIHQPIMKWKWKFDGSCKARLCFPSHRQRHGIDYFLAESLTVPSPYVSRRRQRRCTSTSRVPTSTGRSPRTSTCSNPSFEDPEFLDHVCKLDQALYGLKQAGRVWYETIDKVMIEFGMTRHPHDPCVYFCLQEDEWIIVPLYVNDNFAGSTNALLEKFVQFLTSKFKTKILGWVEHFLGINVLLQPDGSYHLEQKEEIKELLGRLLMAEAKPATSPFTEAEPEKILASPPMDKTIYHSAIGSLYWIAMATHPDILAAVNLCSQYQGAPTKGAWAMVKKIL